MLGELTTFIELTEKAGGWLATVLQHNRRERDRRAAQVLYNAFVLTASMRTYDNTFRRILGRLLVFDGRWEQDERSELLADLLEFFDTETVLPRFRQALAALENANVDEQVRAGLDRLLTKAGSFHGQVDEVTGRKSEFHIPRTVLDALRRGDDQESVEEIVFWAEEYVDLLDRRVLAEADEAFGVLRQTVLSKHNLPDPGWAVQV